MVINTLRGPNSGGGLFPIVRRRRNPMHGIEGPKVEHVANPSLPAPTGNQPAKAIVSSPDPSGADDGMPTFLPPAKPAETAPIAPVQAARPPIVKAPVLTKVKSAKKKAATNGRQATPQANV